MPRLQKWQHVLYRADFFIVLVINSFSHRLSSTLTHDMMLVEAVSVGDVASTPDDLVDVFLRAKQLRIFYAALNRAGQIAFAYLTTNLPDL